jgi:hypothetical protein
MPRYSTLILLLTAVVTLGHAQTDEHPWLTEKPRHGTIASEIPVPKGFRRTRFREGSFGDWLRHLPLKKKASPVLLHNGKKKPNQDVHAAVIDIDVGTRDLQQCADAVIRLRAEYLFSRRRFGDIHFNFTSGGPAYYTKWASGYRPVVDGDTVTWEKRAGEDKSYACFRKYLDIVFAYAGSYSLSKELAGKPDLESIETGDVFIKGGFPGHAIIVVDMAEHEETGEKLFLIAQSYMPAQDIHVLKNPTNDALSPWYRLPSGNTLITPEWRFKTTELKTFQ